MPKKIGTGILACFLLPMAVLSRDMGPLNDTSQPSRKTAKKPRKPVTVQYGVASFYADKFEGRKTYTDEIFSQQKLTAASNTLPMQTWVRVTNLRNHLSVVLRINDKMHPRNRRLIDLSHAAAAKLGYASRGLTRVKVEVLGKKKPREAEEELAAKEK